MINLIAACLKLQEKLLTFPLHMKKLMEQMDCIHSVHRVASEKMADVKEELNRSVKEW